MKKVKSLRDLYHAFLCHSNIFLCHSSDIEKYQTAEVTSSTLNAGPD